MGLSTSVFLGRLGIEHMLVERHAETSTHPRGRGNNVRTMEIFRAAGLEQSVREAAFALAGNDGVLQVDTLAGNQRRWIVQDIAAGMDVSRVSSSNWCLCSQNDLEPVLLNRARQGGTSASDRSCFPSRRTKRECWHRSCAGTPVRPAP